MNAKPTRIILLFITASTVLLAGCSRKTGDKYIDYGDGVINLHHVTKVTTANSSFYNARSPGDNGPKSIYLEFSTQERDRFSFSFPNPEETLKVFKKIKKFMEGTDTYLKLEL